MGCWLCCRSTRAFWSLPLITPRSSHPSIPPGACCNKLRAENLQLQFLSTVNELTNRFSAFNKLFNAHSDQYIDAEILPPPLQLLLPHLPASDRPPPPHLPAHPALHDNCWRPSAGGNNSACVSLLTRVTTADQTKSSVLLV